MNLDYAQFLLNKTQRDYNIIAKQFANTRELIRQDIKELVKLVKPRDRILDSGCGSGRLYQALKNKPVDYVGIDISEELIKIAQQKNPGGKFLVTDSLSLPFENNFFNKVFSIAVLHHLPSKELRLKYLKEAYRVLKPGGLLVLRVWNLFRAKKGGWKNILKFSFLKLLGKTELDWFDVFAPWKNPEGKVVAELYFHCFTQKKLRKLAQKAGFKVKKLWLGKSNIPNIYLIAEK
jgi:ubiquinone/menaquinone biosynthesis C-methylase UbiE